jgi:hypothetical protein
MNERTSIIETPVLIAGGGPIGLALAADLGRRGVATLLVEKNDNKLGSAKMLEVSVRTMEFCRQLGVIDDVRHWGFPFDYPLDNAFVTDMQGYEIGRLSAPSLGDKRDSAFSPERGMMCPQTWFDPILQKQARSFPHVTIRHHVRLESFAQDPDGVTATLHDQATGAIETVRAVSRRLRRLCQHGSGIARHRGARRASYRLVDERLSPHPRLLFVPHQKTSHPLRFCRARRHLVVHLAGRRQGPVAAAICRRRREQAAEP